MGFPWLDRAGCVQVGFSLDGGDAVGLGAAAEAERQKQAARLALTTSRQAGPHSSSGRPQQFWAPANVQQIKQNMAQNEPSVSNLLSFVKLTQTQLE